jgi:glutaredoxin
MRAALAAWIALGIAAACDAGAQQFYRWVDKDGGVHYSQQPPPKGAARTVERRKLGSSVIETSQPSFALQQAMKKYPVTLFTSPGCKQGCPEARQLLTARGVPFNEVSVADDESNEMLKKATGDNKVPSLTVGTAVQIGYEQSTVHLLLDTAGYPKTPAFTGKPPALPPLPGRTAPPAPEIEPAAPSSDGAPDQPR